MNKITKPILKILVACHKDDVAICKDYPYFPIHVGKSLSSVNLGLAGDNTGDNISTKNPYFCELTSLYWAWKNLKDVDIIGLSHYRRYFDFHHQCHALFPVEVFSEKNLEELDLSIPDNIIDKVQGGAIVVAQPKRLPYSIKIDYCVNHNSEDFRTLENLIHSEGDGIYIRAFDTVMNKSNKLRPFNMFIMKWDDFDNYCKWLFNILFQLENKIDITNYNTMQSRIWGFMGERLFNVWLKANNKKLISLPIIKIDNHNSLNVLTYLRTMINIIRKEISFLCNKPIW